MNDYYRFKFINFLKGNIDLEYKEFKELLIKYFSEYINKLYEKYNCEFIVSTKMSAAGRCIGTEEIKINEYVVDNIYKGNLFYLTIIFHEISHLDQNIKIGEGHYDENVLNYIKDQLLDIYQHEQNGKFYIFKPLSYYEKNYKCFSKEIEADLNSILLFLNFSLENKINLSDETINMIETLAYQTKSNQTKKRYVGGNVIFNSYYLPLNEAFDFAIKDHPEWLEIYPQLKEEYYIMDYKVYKKDNINQELVDNSRTTCIC